MPHDVFISHSSKDKPVADAVCAALERSGVRCWVAPRDILPGANWAESILKAIADSRLIVLVFSRHTQESQHIPREVERAVHHGIAIAPVRIDDVMPAGDLEYFLSSSHWMDAMSPPLDRHLDALCRQVRTLLDCAARRRRAGRGPGPRRRRSGAGGACLRPALPFWRRPPQGRGPLSNGKAFPPDRFRPGHLPRGRSSRRRGRRFCRA